MFPPYRNQSDDFQSNCMLNASDCSSFLINHSCRIFSFIGSVLTSHQSIFFWIMRINFTLFFTIETVTFATEVDRLSLCRFAFSWCANRLSRLSFQSIVHIFLIVTMKFDKTCITIFLKEWCKMHCMKCVQTQIFIWSMFSPKTGKYGPEKTPNLDTFHAVMTAFYSFAIFNEFC